MSIVANVIAAVIKSVAGDNLGNGLIKELASISIDGVSEKGINEITKFINKERSKIDSILSKDNMRFMEISEENIGYVVAEIKDLLSKINITDEVLRQCRYDNMNLSIFLWNEYKECKNDYIECEREIKRCLFTVAEALINLVYESENFEKDVLIYISNLVDDTNAGLQNISEYMEYNFDKLDADNRIVLEMQQKIIEEIQNAGTKDQYKKHKVKSRTQEYADKWNANMFLNDFDKRDENASVNVKLSEVYLDEHLPHYIWGENKNERSDLKDLLEEYINEHNENKMLLILGQPGIGKSTLITWMTANFADRLDDILVYRFASELKDIDWHKTRLAHRILEELGLEYNDLNGKTIILDGLDEVSIDNRREILDELYDNLIFENYIKKFSLIITCRENYVKERDRVKGTYIILQPWDETQIRSFHNIFQEKVKNSVSENTIEKIIEKRDILGIPLILYMVLALNISIEKEGSIVEVYDKIFSLEGGIYDRCINNKSFALPHRIREIKQQIHQISSEIAMWMFENNSEEVFIPMEEYEKKCDNIIRKENNEKLDYLIGNYYKLVKHCEGMDSNKIYFIHRTIYEYFTSEYIYKSINEGINYNDEKIAGILGDLFKRNNLSKEILEFLKCKIEKNRLKNEYQSMHKIFELMIKDGMTFYINRCLKNVFECEMNVFYNMLEFLHLWENCHLKLDHSISRYLYRYRALPVYSNIKSYTRYMGVNLSGADLSQIFFYHADLRYSNMSNTNLKGISMHWMDLCNVNFAHSNLENVNFYKCCFQDVDFEGANMAEVSLRNADILDVNFHNANLEGADFSNADIIFVQSSSPKESYYIRGDFEGVNLKKAIFQRAKLIGANFTKADLEDADFREADIEDADFSQANINRTIFDDNQIKGLEQKFDLHGTKIFVKKTEEVLDYEVYCKNFGKEQ